MIIIKFELDSKVKLISTGRIGTVEKYKVECSFKNGVVTSKKQYYIRFNEYTATYFDENDITEFHDLTVSKKFEENLANLMIDINLSQRNFNMVKEWNETKNNQ